MKVMFTNADQMTPSKMVELKKQIETEKPLIVAVCEVKQKNPAESSVMDYDIPGYSIRAPSNQGNVSPGSMHFSFSNAMPKMVHEESNQTRFTIDQQEHGIT